MQDKKITQTSYQDYNKASQVYDSNRKVIGMKQILGSLKQHNVKLDNLVDIGCGTGSYLLALNQEYKQATGVEPNQGMLSRFASKVKELNLDKKITLINASAQQIPLSDSSFDAAIATLTIHHHGSKENKQKFLNQVYRILKPGGVFIIIHIYDENLKAPWYYHYNKKIMDAMVEKCGTKELMIELGVNAGLKFRELTPIKQFYGQYQSRLGQNLLKKEGRQSLSNFSLLTEEEDLAFEKWAKDLFQNQKIDDFVKENCQKAIDTVGYAGNFVFTKDE